MVNLIGYAPIDPYDETYLKKRKRENYMRRLDPLDYKLHDSTRFLIMGNIGYKITITDKSDDLEYVLEYQELVRFRIIWNKIIYHNRDKFIVATIITRKGTPAKKVA